MALIGIGPVSDVATACGQKNEVPGKHLSGNCRDVWDSTTPCDRNGITSLTKPHFPREVCFRLPVVLPNQTVFFPPFLLFLL